MFIVRKLSTGKVHATSSRDSHETTCGQPCRSNIINECNHGFGSIKNTNEILNVPEVTCKKCIKLNHRR